MSEEKFTMAESDEVTLIIAERLGERQRKFDKMAEWEVEISKSHTRRKLVVSAAIAACLLIGLVVTPMLWVQESPLDRLGIESPAMTEFRAASPEMEQITNLISQSKYYLALSATKEALQKSDLSLDEFEGLGDYMGDEELIYEEELQKTINSELRWTYIYLLVKTECIKEARKQIKVYLKNKSYCSHENEARALYEALK